MTRYYPRQGFAKYLGNDKALLDYLAPQPEAEALIYMPLAIGTEPPTLVGLGDRLIPIVWSP